MQAAVPENRLRELREKHGLKLYDLSAKLRKDPSTVYRYETRGQIPDDVKFALAELYDVSVSYLMGWDEVAA